jgi:hypothetical protein
MFWSWEGLFEVYDFGSGSTGEITSELEVDAESGDGHHKADEPVDQSETNGSCRVKDASGCLGLVHSRYHRRYHLRVEKIPVPIIWLTLRKMMVSHPT